MERNDFYIKLIDFFADWNYVKISDFYRSERDMLSPEYTLREDRYYEGRDNKELVKELFNDDYIRAWGKLFGKNELLEKWEEYKTDDFADWFFENYDSEYALILEALAKKYLVEWILSSVDSKKVVGVLSYPTRYSEWEQDVEDCELTRDQMARKYGHSYYNCYLYHRIVERRSLDILFSGINGGHLYKHRKSIIRLLVKHGILENVEFYYKKEYKHHKNVWDIDIFKIEEPDQEYECPVPENEKLKLIKDHVFVGEGNNRKKKSVDKELLFKTIHKLANSWNPDDSPNKHLTLHLWHYLFSQLCEMRLLNFEKRLPYKEFVDSVVKYVFPRLKRDFRQNLSKDLPKTSKFKDELEEQKMVIKERIYGYLTSLKDA